MMVHEAEPTPRPASGPAFDEQPTDPPAGLVAGAGRRPRPARPASGPAFDEQPTNPVLAAWRALTGAPPPARPAPEPAFDEQPTTPRWRTYGARGQAHPVRFRSIVADILPTHGRAYARLRVRGVLDRRDARSLLQTCRCLVRRNVVRILIDVTDLEGDGARLEDLVELHLGLEKRGGGIGLIAPPAPSSRTWAPCEPADLSGRARGPCGARHRHARRGSAVGTPRPTHPADRSRVAVVRWRAHHRAEHRQPPPAR